MMSQSHFTCPQITVFFSPLRKAPIHSMFIYFKVDYCRYICLLAQSDLELVGLKSCERY